MKNLQGTKILVMEETTVSQRLYIELKDYVDKVIVCDPHRNRLLSEGPKTDKIDARKLVRLLRAGLIKEVYHFTNKFLFLRRLVSGYMDPVTSLVWLKNQRYSLLRACGKNGNEKENFKLETETEQYVLSCIGRQISYCSEEKKVI